MRGTARQGCGVDGGGGAVPCGVGRWLFHNKLGFPFFVKSVWLILKGENNNWSIVSKTMSRAGLTLIKALFCQGTMMLPLAPPRPLMPLVSPLSLSLSYTSPPLLCLAFHSLC